MSLTDLSIKKLKIPEKGRTTYADESVPGFGVRVTASGVKSFVLLLGRNRRRITIGRYPTITLAEARIRARLLVAERLLGKDDVPSMKFEDAIPIFIASRYGDDYIKPRTRNETERLLRKHFLPKFRHEQLTNIKTYEIADVIDRLRKAPSLAHHAFGVIRLFFRWAERRRYVLHSPCAILERPRPSAPRDRFLTRDEVKAVLTTARDIDSTYSTIVELLLLTGQRRGEIANLRAEWIDWQAQTITLPRAITKNKRRHTIPFGKRAAELLRKGHSKGLLFPARGTEGKRPFDGWTKSKPRFDKRCPLEPWTLHDLRRTFATNLAALGVPIQVTEKLLNHVSGTMSGIVAVYQRHTYEKEMRCAIEQWEGFIASLMQDVDTAAIDTSQSLPKAA